MVQIHKNNGFGLIEVLIALFILSIGLLALANLNVKGLQISKEANFRAQAYIAIDEMAGRLRANNNYIYNTASINLNPGAFSVCYTTAGCTEEELLRNDIFEWGQNVSTLLPGGIGVVCLDSTPGDMSDIDPSGSTGCDNVDAATPANRVLAIKIAWQKREGGFHTLETTVIP